jgi:methylmalonyl-CoA/ethylmalonyl-CoA epimerase
VIECAFFGRKARFHHIGLAVKSIREVSPSSEVVADETQRVWMAFVRLNGITVELLEPYGEDSPIERSLREGVKLLHLCYEVPNLEEALELCRPAGFHRIRPATPAPVYDNRRVVWVFSRQWGLVELIERPDLAA